MILAITSSTARVGCAIGDADGVRAVVQATRSRRHAELLSVQISAACVQAGISLKDISVVAVDVGPGLYTGLRVGVMTSVTIAHTLGLPMIAVSSLDVIAFGLRFTDGLVAAVIDARRNEVFWSVYKSGSACVTRLSAPKVASPDEAASKIVSYEDQVLMAGDGAVQYARAFTGLSNVQNVQVADKGFAYPSAESLLFLAKGFIFDDSASNDSATKGFAIEDSVTGSSATVRSTSTSSSISTYTTDSVASGSFSNGRLIAHERLVSPSQVVPMYLRRPDARPQPHVKSQSKHISHMPN